jgi:serpin B
MVGRTPVFGLLALIALTIVFAGCVSPQPAPGPGHNATLDADNSVVQGNNRFAMDLYSQYKGKEGNVFFSPFSISTALAMTYEGADGKTADEMSSVLHLPVNDTVRREGFSALISVINKGDGKSVLRTANALWLQKDQPLLDSYLRNVRDNYGGEATSLDFKADPDGSRIHINDWVANQTEDKIKDLIPRGLITESTKLVLTNAVYFKGEWVRQFNETFTKEGDFRSAPGVVKKAMLMHAEDEFYYMENEELQMLEMPYSGGNLSMLILLPKGDGMGSLESSLTPENLQSWKQALGKETVQVYMPKFKFDTSYMLGDTLEGMGMQQAFSDSADFSGMTGAKDLKISEVVHKAFVEVDEKGTEDAAATAVIMVPTSIGPGTHAEIPVFRADHPFIFIIQQKGSGNILFMGRVSDPTAG